MIDYRAIDVEMETLLKKIYEDQHYPDTIADHIQTSNYPSIKIEVKRKYGTVVAWIGDNMYVYIPDEPIRKSSIDNDPLINYMTTIYSLALLKWHIHNKTYIDERGKIWGWRKAIREALETPLANLHESIDTIHREITYIDTATAKEIDGWIRIKYNREKKRIDISLRELEPIQGKKIMASIEPYRLYIDFLTRYIEASKHAYTVILNE